MKLTVAFFCTPGARGLTPKEGIMKDRASSVTLSGLRCPVCGTVQSRRTSAARANSFVCTRCHARVEVTVTRSLAVVLASVTMALSLGLAIGLQEPSFGLILAGAAAAFNWLGQSLRSFVAAPKLKVLTSGQDRDLPKNVLSTQRRHGATTATPRREPLLCPLVVTHD